MHFISKVFFLGLMVFLLSFLPALPSYPASESELQSKTSPGLNLPTNPIIDDFLVNDDNGSTDQSSPSIAEEKNGNFVITWDDYRDGFFYLMWYDPSIYAQKYNSAGVPLGPNFRVSTSTGTAPAIAMDSSGNFVIAWQDYFCNPPPSPCYADDIYAQRYDFTSNPLGSNFKVNDITGIPYTWSPAPAIAMNGSGNFLISWGSQNVGSYLYDIYAQRYNSTGIPLGSNFKVNDDTGSTQQKFPAVAMGMSGNFLITWTDGRSGNFDIYAQKYDSAGVRVGSNFRVNDDAGSFPQGYSATAINNSGYSIITWHDDRNGNSDIYAQRYGSTGNPIGSNFKVNDDGGSAAQLYPSVAIGSSGKFIIAWQDARNGNYDIYSQRYDSAGSPVGSNYLVNNLQYLSFNQAYPAVAANSSFIYFTWQDNRRDKGWDIWAKVVDWNWTKVGDDQESSVSNSFELSQNYPNPFNPSTKIQFRVGSLKLGEPIHTFLIIYNILGQKVRTLVDEEKVPGNYNIIWDGKDNSGKEVSSGIYFYQLKTKDYTDTKKMVLLR